MASHFAQKANYLQEGCCVVRAGHVACMYREKGQTSQTGLGLKSVGLLTRPRIELGTPSPTMKYEGMFHLHHQATRITRISGLSTFSQRWCHQGTLDTCVRREWPFTKAK